VEANGLIADVCERDICRTGDTIAGFTESIVQPSFELQQLRRDLKPFRLHWFPRLRSTNDHAAILRKRGSLFAPAIVLTGHQLAGRGRGSNTWWSGEGSLTVTFVLPIDEHLAPHHVPLIAGLAVRNAAAHLAMNEDIQLKWPNDLLYKNCKLAGLLCERIDKADLIGVGLNVNVKMNDVPKHLRERVTSLNEISGRPIDPNTAIAAIAGRLHAMLSHRDDQNFRTVLREYDQHHALLGRRVTVTNSSDESPITGKCEGLDDTGRLLLRDRKTLHRVIAGHVQML
jgi:BirA family biotin operon repressor/biotin-[acetyl-CoA-carboxylase] ligase